MGYGLVVGQRQYCVATLCCNMVNVFPQGFEDHANSWLSPGYFAPCCGTLGSWRVAWRWGAKHPSGSHVPAVGTPWAPDWVDWIRSRCAQYSPARVVVHRHPATHPPETRLEGAGQGCEQLTVEDEMSCLSIPGRACRTSSIS
jgi:hypothetical protein